MNTKLKPIDERLANAELFDKENLSNIFAFAWSFVDSYDGPISPDFVIGHIKEAILEEIVSATDIGMP